MTTADEAALASLAQRQQEMNDRLLVHEQIDWATQDGRGIIDELKRAARPNIDASERVRGFENRKPSSAVDAWG